MSGADRDTAPPSDPASNRHGCLSQVPVIDDNSLMVGKFETVQPLIAEKAGWRLARADGTGDESSHQVRMALT